jgi:prephenate dehydratase
VLIAYQGESGAFSEAAAAQFDPQATAVACPSFEDVFRSVETSKTTCGILPIENSIGGTIHRNYDLMLEHDLKIVGEVELPVVHNLVALPGTRLEQVRQVISHPQALAQCDRFLRQLHDIEIIATYDTAGSAKLITERNLPDVAAIASERAASIFGLDVLQKSIQDFADNVTRFLIVTRPAAVVDLLGSARLKPFGKDKTTVVFTLPNTPGSLFRALSAFALRSIDVTKVESRPLPGRPWEYLFYLDVGAGDDDQRCRRALIDLAEFAPTLKTLGSYPSAVTVRKGAAAAGAASSGSVA